MEPESLGSDTEERFLQQARLAAEVAGMEVEFRRLLVWDVALLAEKFDLVFFLGVLYHLRHLLLALHLLHEHVAKNLLLFQSMRRGSRDLTDVQEDYDITGLKLFHEPAYPKLHFIEREYFDDMTNWKFPNLASTEAMLRSAGFAIEAKPKEEVSVFRWQHLVLPPGGPHPVLPEGRF